MFWSSRKNIYEDVKDTWEDVRNTIKPSEQKSILIYELIMKVEFEKIGKYLLNNFAKYCFKKDCSESCSSCEYINNLMKDFRLIYDELRKMIPHPFYDDIWYYHDFEDFVCSFVDIEQCEITMTELLSSKFQDESETDGEVFSTDVETRFVSELIMCVKMNQQDSFVWVK